MPTRHIRLALLILAVAAILAIRWQDIRQAVNINLAYISLAHSIEKPDPASAARFTAWAAQTKSSPCERAASAYGLSMLLSHTSGNLSAKWLQAWNKIGCRLTTVAGRDQLIEWNVTASLAPQTLLPMLACLDDPTVAQWLISAAEKRPHDSSVYVGEIERRGLVSGLSQADRIRLAAVYSSLADQIRQSGGSTEEIMALVNKSLALDPLRELALSIKALMLRNTGQLSDGIALLERVTLLHPEYTFAWECLAYIRIDNSDYQGAESAARSSIRSVPSDRSSWGKNLLAIALLRQGRCAEALPYALVTTRGSPEAPNYLLTLGDIYWCLGDRAQASRVYQKLEGIHPGYASYVHELILSTKK